MAGRISNRSVSPPDGSATEAAPPVGLYVHVPFCVSLCPYCDFVVVTGSATRGVASRIGAYVDAVAVEIGLRADALDRRFPERRPLTSVYFGGGTPSLLGADAIGDLLDLVHGRFGLADDAEVTLEANPGPEERGSAAEFVEAGVTRLSFGAQSMDPGELRRLGRRHRPQDVIDAMSEARAAGTTSVSLDLLYDVPGQSEESWKASLVSALELRPDHLSLYALTLEDPDAVGLTGPTGDHLPVRAGARRWREGARRDQDDDRAASQCRWAAQRLNEDGWRGYEISNWARPGHKSRHNLAYWRRLPVEAVGPGAHAFDGEVRRWNAARLDVWMAALMPERGEARLPPGGEERLDHRAAMSEAAMLALRTDDGVASELFDALDDAAEAALSWAVANALAERTSAGGVRLTLEGRLLSNEVFERLL